MNSNSSLHSICIVGSFLLWLQPRRVVCGVRTLSSEDPVVGLSTVRVSGVHAACVHACMFCFMHTARTLVCVPLGSGGFLRHFRIRYSRRDILLRWLSWCYFVMPPVLRPQVQALVSPMRDGHTRLDPHAPPPASTWLWLGPDRRTVRLVFGIRSLSVARMSQARTGRGPRLAGRVLL